MLRLQGAMEDLGQSLQEDSFGMGLANENCSQRERMWFLISPTAFVPWLCAPWGRALLPPPPPIVL